MVRSLVKKLTLNHYYGLIFCLLIYSCNNSLSEKRKLELWSMSRSNNVDSIVIATIEIQKTNDTNMFDVILYKPNDPRITLLPFQKGMSVYQIKMTALKQITEIIPPIKITYMVNTSIINFYKEKIKKEEK